MKSYVFKYYIENNNKSVMNAYVRINSENSFEEMSSLAELIGVQIPHDYFNVSVDFGKDIDNGR